jgi:hypothetical protein
MIKGIEPYSHQGFMVDIPHFHTSPYVISMKLISLRIRRKHPEYVSDKPQERLPPALKLFGSFDLNYQMLYLVSMHV